VTLFFMIFFTFHSPQFSRSNIYSLSYIKHCNECHYNERAIK
jgi:hypothetical protein